MSEFLDSIQNSSFSIWIQSTELAYPTILALHAIGMALLVGLCTMIALRILGFAPSLPLVPMAKFFPMIYLSFWINALSGLVLTALSPMKFFTNPTFYIKLVSIAGAVVAVRYMRSAAFEVSGSRASGGSGGRTPAIVSLVLWGSAIVAGRLTAYSGYVAWRSLVAILIAVAAVLAGRYVGARLIPGRAAVSRD